MIAENVAKGEGMKATGAAPCTYLNANGGVVPTSGTIPIKLRTIQDNHHNVESSANIEIQSKAVITPAIKNEIIIGRNDLKQLQVIPKKFPAPIMVISQDQFEKFNKLRNKLISNNPTVLTDKLPQDAMDGCVMKIPHRQCQDHTFAGKDP